MIEIEYKEKEKVDSLYNEVKNIILTKKDNQSFDYKHKQHHLYEESEYPGISKNYYNESGSVEFENINGKIIGLEIYRWHPHKHNGCSGLNGNPCLTAVIYTIENEEKQVLWELNVKSGTLYYKAEVSSLEIPNDILQEKHIPYNSNIQENKVTGTLCFSVHPLDFLSSSENNYNWRSCHALDGEYRAGNLSYMLDKSTIICYLKGAEKVKLPLFPEYIPWNNKKWRVLLHFSENWDIIFAGRQYPFESEEGIEIVRTLLLSKINKDVFSYCKWTDPVIYEIPDSYDHEYDLLHPYIAIRG